MGRKKLPLPSPKPCLTCGTTFQPSRKHPNVSSCSRSCAAKACHPGKKGAYVHEHKRVAARALGKPLPRGAQVHHVNGNPRDNRNCNLVICQDAAYHRLLHVRAKALALGADPNTERVCIDCRKPKPFAEFNRDNGNIADGITRLCKACGHARYLVRRARMAA